MHPGAHTLWPGIDRCCIPQHGPMALGPKSSQLLGGALAMAMAAMGQDPNSLSPKRRQGTWNWIFGCCRARSPRQGHPCDEAPPNAKFPHMGPPNESIQ